jgi:outer membrane cobalamin receptor
MKLIILSPLPFLFLLCGMARGQESPTPTMTSLPTPVTTLSTPVPSNGGTNFGMAEVVIYGEKDKGETWKGKELDALKNNGGLSSFLEKAGGLETQGLGGAKTASNASIRGSSTQETLVLLNGQKTGEGFDLGLIPIGDIIRVEVLKGPAALAYGPEATGGVINIITRPKEGGASLGASGGDFNTWQLQASTGGWKAGAWQGSFSGNWYQTGGYTTNTDEVSGELSHQSQWILGDDRLSLRAGYVYKNGGAPNGDSLSAQDTGQFDADDREKRNAVDTSLEGEHRSGDWIFRPVLSYSFADIARLNPLGPDAVAGVPLADENLYGTYGLKAGASAKWAGLLQSLDLGLEFRAQSIQGTEGLGGEPRWNDVASFSAQGGLDLGGDFSLDGGGRLDWYATYDLLVFNPQGTLKYSLEPGKDLYLGAGTGFRYPDFDELYHPALTYVTGPDTPVEFGAGERGNPNLSPESSVNLEAGTDLFWGAFQLKVSGFLQSFSNLIVPAQDASNYWTFLNVSHALLLGTEAGFRWSLWEGGTLRGDYTYVDSRNQESGQLIPARMRQKLSGGFTLVPAKGAEWTLDGRFVDHNPAIYNGPQDSPPLVVVSSYWVLDTGFKLDIAKDSRFFLSLDNLLNQTYATFQGLPMPGRYLEMGTTVGF